MANTSVTTTIRAGMNSDLNQYNLEKGQYSFAFNAAVEDFSGNGFPLIQNDSSNYLAINFPIGFEVIGKKFILELNITLWFIVNPNSGVGQIGYSKPCRFVDSNDSADYGICADCVGKVNKEETPLEKVTQTPYCSYFTIVSSDCFGFSMNYPVDAEYRIVNNALYIYFVDGLNKLRFIYFNIIDSIPVLQDKFKVVTGYDAENCDQPIYSDELDCNKILYNPNYEVTKISNIEDVYGGSLPAGVYQVMIAYADSLGNPLTSYFASSNPYPLRTKNITIETNYNTFKALSFTVDDLDQTGIFQYYNIVIAQTVDNFTDFFLVATQPITTKNFLYTGSNQVIKKLDPNSVFFRYGIFETATSITKANDYLFFANLKQYRRLNLQRAVSQIKAYWQTIAISEQELRKPENVSKYRGCLRDEVYPYGIVFEFTDDNDSITYPLVGPAKDSYAYDVDRIIANADVIRQDSCGNQAERDELWQMYSTASIEAAPHQISVDCEDDRIWEWGKFSYWESTETYPNIPEVWGDLCGKPIRHFKYPDSTVTHMHNGLLSTSIYENSNIIFPIGIRIDHDSVKAAIAWAVDNNLITQAEADTIKGYRIVRGNRAGNKSIQAKGLLYDMWNYSKDNKTYYYPNFPYNDLGENIFLAPDISTYDGGNDSSPNPSSFVKTGRYTFHSPDTHFTNTSLGSELKLETEEYGKSEGYFNNCNRQPKYKILSTAARSLCFAAGFASATSHVTKECRDFQHIGKYITVGTADSYSQYVQFKGQLKYNTFGVSTPQFPATYTDHDCKGTAYNWMNTIQVAEMTPEHYTGGAIMLSVLAVTGFLDMVGYGLFFFADALSEIAIYTKLLQSLTPAKNYFIQYNSVGRYNSYKVVSNNGNKIRKLDYATYLDTNLEYVDELVGNIIVNNRDRESSVMLRTDPTKPLFPNTSVIDNSRVSMDSAGIGSLNQKFNRDISSYYASVRNYVPDQYGTIYNISYLETGANSFLIEENQSEATIFGGDTFISRFGLKIKHPMFTQTRFNQLDNADVSYSELGNAAYPNYYLDYGEGIMEKLSTFSIGDILTHPGNFFQDLVGTDDTRLDAKREKFFYQQGYVHLYNYGIPYFLVESDVNVDYRHGENDTDLDYYPHQSDLDIWLQEENVPINRDNAYIYNSTYSKQNKESVLQTAKPDTLFGDASIINDSNLLIYTERAQTLNEGDNWKILRPDNFYRVNSVYGTIVSIDGIESDKVLIRCENGSQIFGAYDTIDTSGGQAQINHSGIFQSRPKEFAVTHLGYMASQHRDILDTEFGHVFVDAKRGNVFNLAAGAAGLDELTKNGMKNWFKNNLPFYISKYFPNLTLTDLDNSFNGIGISLCFDRRFNRMFLTKLDYAPKSSDISYSSSLKKFYLNDDIVDVKNPTYFDNKSWTISYNFATQMWSSFHSFIPNYYVDYIDSFQSGINGSQSSVWSHGVSNKSYQVYYGNISPFIIDIPTPFTGQNNVLNSVSYVNEVIRYQNEYDYFFNNYITFNKAVVYNNNKNTGQLLLTVSNPNDLQHKLPKITADGREVFVSSPEGTWNINEFFDSTKSTYNNVPLWNYDKANVNKDLNLSAFNYYKADTNQAVMRGRMFNLRLVNDIHSNYKFLFILQSFNSTESIK